MKAIFRIIKLTRYKNVGNVLNLDYADYLKKKNDVEMALYGHINGTYYLPAFEVTLENGLVGIYENYYDGEIIEEISPKGFNFKVSDGDTLGFLEKDAKIISFQDLCTTRELNIKCLNSDFQKNISDLINGNEEQYQEHQRRNIASQAVFAAGLRDCEVYVIN